MNNRGHNLLEVIIATVIFATAVVFMTGLWASYHQALTMNRGRLLAMAVGRSELESRMALGYSNLIPLFGTHVKTYYNFDCWIRGKQITLPFEADFTAIDCKPAFPRLVHLSVTVSWNEKTGPDIRTLPSGTFGNMSVTYDSHLFDAH